MKEENVADKDLKKNDIVTHHEKKNEKIEIISSAHLTQIAAVHSYTRFDCTAGKSREKSLGCFLRMGQCYFAFWKRLFKWKKK